MLDAYIIEEIKRQEEERRRKEDSARPRLQIEIPMRRPPEKKDNGEDKDEKREDEEPEEGDEDRSIIHIDL